MTSRVGGHGHGYGAEELAQDGALVAPEWGRQHGGEHGRGLLAQAGQPGRGWLGHEPMRNHPFLKRKVDARPIAISRLLLDLQLAIHVGASLECRYSLLKEFGAK